jgi:hypothetical protein
MRKRLLKIGAVVVVLGALAGGGVAWGTAGGDDENVTGPAADRARAAALAHIGDGQVVGVERESEGGAVWEVEISRPDGSTVEVALDANYNVVGSGAEEDQDEAGEDDAGENED